MSTGQVAIRYDECPETFFSAIILAATVLFWLWKSMSQEPIHLGPGHHEEIANRSARNVRN